MSATTIFVTVLVAALSLCIRYTSGSPISVHPDATESTATLRTSARQNFEQHQSDGTLTNLSARYLYKAPGPVSAPAPVYASKGEYCSSILYCDKGLTCIGTGGRAQCYGVMKHGGVCDVPYMICASGTACRAPAYGTGPKKCVAPRVKGNGCDTGYHFCGSGLTCAPYGSGKRCVSVMQENEDCSKTFMLCAKGLVCTGSGTYRQCKKPRSKKGEYCSATLKCADGLTCVGSGSEAVCIGVMGYGGVCSGTYMACASGLWCRAPAYGSGPKKCVSPRVKGNGCDGGYHFCGSGLSCIKWGSATRCVSLVGVGGDCSPSFSLCKHKAVCTGKPGYRKCVLPKPVYTPPPAPASKPTAFY